MANEQAYSAVKSVFGMVGPGSPLVLQLERLKDNLAAALNAEQTVVDLRKQVDPLKSQIADLTAKTLFAEKDYADRSAKAEATYKELLNALQKQESAKQAQIEVLVAQGNELERAVENTKQELQKRLADVQNQGAAKQRELEKEYAARKVMLDMEETAARERVEGYKADLALLLKRVTG